MRSGDRGADCAEVRLSNSQRDQWFNEGLHQSRDHAAEGCADHHADCHIHNISTQDEFLESVEHNVAPPKLKWGKMYARAGRRSSQMAYLDLLSFRREQAQKSRIPTWKSGPSALRKPAQSKGLQPLPQMRIGITIYRYL